MLYFAELGREKRQRRREARERRVSEDLTSEKGTFEEFIEEEGTMSQPEERTLRDLLALNVDQQPFYISYLATTCNFELKLGLIHLLPTFCIRAGDHISI